MITSIRNVLSLKASGILLAAGLAGCQLPSEQLVLPGGFGPPVRQDTSIPGNSFKKGPIDVTPGQIDGAEPRAYRGTGEFADYPQPKYVAAADQAKDGVTINLVGASISEAAKTILGDLLKLNYTISERVKATITLQTTRPVSRDGLLEIFESVLRTEGAAITVDGGVYKIVPLDDALAAGPAIRARGSSNRQIGVSTQIVPLRYVAAAEMERILKSVAPQVSIVRADPARNLIVVAGTKIDIASALDAVGVFDTDYMKGMSFAILPVESADPDAIAQELDTVFANDRDSPTKGVVRFVPNKRLRAVLVISPRAEYLDKAKAWLSRLDLVGRANERQIYTYRVQSRPAAELAGLVQKVYGQSAGGQGAGRTSSLSTSAIPSDSPTGGGSNGGAIPSVSIPGVSPGGGAQGGRSATSADQGGVASTDPTAPSGPSGGGTQTDEKFAGVSIVPDEANNVLIITCTPLQYRWIRQILERVDNTPNQVLLEATIAEVTLNDALKFGLRWFFNGGGNKFQSSDVSSGAVTASFPGFSYFLNTPNVQVALNALSTVTDVNVVSSPTLMVLDNKKASLQVGDEVPVATQSAVSVTSPGAPIVNSVSFRNTGVILNITPRVGDHGQILLDIEQEVSDVIPTTSSNINSPTIQQRRVKTTVSVNDGESILLAGLMQDKTTNSRTQIPVLGEIPYVGNLFKNKNNTINRTELMIAITPSVVRNPNQSRGITAEFRDKLNFTTRPQRAGPPDRKEQLERLLR